MQPRKPSLERKMRSPGQYRVRRQRLPLFSQSASIGLSCDRQGRGDGAQAEPLGSASIGLDVAGVADTTDIMPRQKTRVP